MTTQKRKNSDRDEPSSIKKKRVASQGTKLTDVCPDCLEKCFKYLDLNDLASIGLVCKLFNEVAANIFSREFNGHCSLAEDSHRGSKKVKLQKIENVFKCFGGALHSLEASSIDGYTSAKPNDKPVLDCITKYFCENVTDDEEEIDDDNENVTVDEEEKGLKKLILSGFHFDASMVENVNNLFGRLNKLTLKKCKLLDGTNELFARCSNLSKLKLDFVHTNPDVVFEYSGRRRKFNKFTKSDALDPVFNHHFPKLTSLSIRCIGTAEDCDLDNFLSKNPQLEKLKIVDCYQFDGVIQSIVTNAPNIEKLCILGKSIKSKGDLLQLKQLKKLEINFKKHAYQNVISALDAFARSETALETLKLVDFQTTEKLINILVQFKTLKKLELVRGGFSDTNLQTLSKKLNKTEITVNN